MWLQDDGTWRIKCYFYEITVALDSVASERLQNDVYSQGFLWYTLLR